VCLSLMEQLIMILVFAVAASFCLRGFAAAQNISDEIGHRDHAVYLTQNAAEKLKADGGEIDKSAFTMISPEIWAQTYDADWSLLTGGENGEYRLEIIRSQAPLPGLGTAKLQMKTVKTGQCLFELTVAWQEATA